MLFRSLDADGRAQLARKPVPTIRRDLLELFEVSELKKYMTAEELVGLPGAEPEVEVDVEPEAEAAVEVETEAEAAVAAEPEAAVAAEPEAAVAAEAEPETEAADVESAETEPPVDIPVQNEPETDAAEKAPSAEADAEGGAQ